jgi:hypothetical protein
LYQTMGLLREFSMGDKPISVSSAVASPLDRSLCAI